VSGLLDLTTSKGRESHGRRCGYPRKRVVAAGQAGQALKESGTAREDLNLADRSGSGLPGEDPRSEASRFVGKIADTGGVALNP